MLKATAQGWGAALVDSPPIRASRCWQPGWLLRASLAPASPLQQGHVRDQGGFREVTAVQRQAGTGTGSQAAPALASPARESPATSEHQAALDLRRMHPGTQKLVPAGAPAPPALPGLPHRASDPLSHPTAAAQAGDALRRTRLALSIYLTAKYSCFSLFLLTGCKFPSGWQLQVGTAWEEPQGQLQACFCQAAEGCPMPWTGRGRGGLRIRLLATGSLSPGQTQEIPKPLQGVYLPSSSSRGQSISLTPCFRYLQGFACTPGTQTLHPLRPPPPGCR